MVKFLDQINELLEAADSREFDAGDLGLEFERAGDLAFDALVDGLGRDSTTDHGCVRGLRALALLTRHHCRGRMMQLAEICVPLMKHEHRAVRGDAVNIGAAMVTLMNLQGAYAEGTMKPLFDRVASGIGSAIESGIDEEFIEAGQLFIHNRGHIPPEPDESEWR